MDKIKSTRRSLAPNINIRDGLGTNTIIPGQQQNDFMAAQNNGEQPHRHTNNGLISLAIN